MLSLVLLIVVAGRVVHLQVIQGPDLAAKALRAVMTTKELPAQRGSISDRNGVPLATTVAAMNVTADQTLIAPKKVKSIAQGLASV